jgi:hypothetical protein
MTQQSPTTWTAAWTVSFSPSFPYYGTVTWSVTATDNLGNVSTVGATPPLSVVAPGCI